MKYSNLGELFNIVAGGTPSRGKLEYYGGNIPWVKISDMLQDHIYFTDEYISEAGLKNSGAKLIPKGTLLISIFATVGRTAFLEIEATTNQAIVGLIPKYKTGVDINYVRFFLDAQVQNIKNLSRGVAQNNINKSILSSIKVPLPPLPIQQKIASILEKTDAARQKRAETLKLTEQFLQSAFLEMFGDPVKNEMGWEVKTVEALVKKEKHSIKRGPFGGALKKEIFVPSGYLVYEQFHALNNDFSFARYFIDEEKFQELKAFEVKAGDIIISCSGVYLGKLAIVPKDSKQGIINQALLKISLDSNIINNEFFVFIFSHGSFRNEFFGENRGSGIPNMPPMDEFKKFRFIYPPRPLQQKFTTLVEKVEKLREKQRQSEAELEQLFQSLMKRAFNGELVREEESGVRREESGKKHLSQAASYFHGIPDQAEASSSRPE